MPAITIPNPVSDWRVKEENHKKKKRSEVDTAGTPGFRSFFLQLFLKICRYYLATTSKRKRRQAHK